MDKSLIVPASCLPQILAQRTGCKKSPDPAAAWADSIRADWDQVEPVLPETCDWSLDIGCGMAGFDILLWRARGTELHLLDRDLFDRKPRYGFGTVPSAYCRFEDVREMLRVNGVPDYAWLDHVELFDGPHFVDLVVSFIAWGFHFPVDVYLEAVSMILRQGGRLIIDLRNEHRNEMMSQIFSAIGPLLKEWPAEKHTRCVFERRG